ncbi:helix-turn-helix transcriptional regulator [Rothia sp. ARF10]|nr:helix-turn-helix transcriptional regulator [Rothia sp. ARF10]
MPQPREFLRHPTQFGRADPAEWKQPVASTRHAQGAARLQHELVRAARQQQERLDQKTDETAHLIGMNPDQLRRIYRGEAGLTLENVYKISKAVGLNVGVTFTRID